MCKEFQRVVPLVVKMACTYNDVYLYSKSNRDLGTNNFFGSAAALYWNKAL